MSVWSIYLHVVISSYYGKCRVVTKNFIHGLRNPLKDFGVQNTTIRIHQHVTCPLSSEVARIQKAPEDREPFRGKLPPKIDRTTTELWMRKRLLTWIRCYSVFECSPNIPFPNTKSMVYLPTFGYNICPVNVGKYTHTVLIDWTWVWDANSIQLFSRFERSEVYSLESIWDVQIFLEALNFRRWVSAEAYTTFFLSSAICVKVLTLRKLRQISLCFI